MLIIDKTATPAPILEWKPKPDFKSETEKQKYWEGEKQKWIEGLYDVPGTLVHKTQEQKIKNRITGELERPICRDGDLLVHQTAEDCKKKGEALIVIKGRGFGLSSDMGCLANYYMKVYPGINVLMTSQELAKIETLFSEKVAITYDNYDDEIKPVEINRNQTKAYCYLKTEQIFRDGANLRKNTSQIICRDTSQKPKSASAFSGTGAKFGAYDELFLHPRWRPLVRSSTSCFVDPKTKEVTGFLLCGGTVEDTITNADVFVLQQMIEKVQKTGMLETIPARVLFVPCWYGYNMTNGWSDEEGGIEWWNRQMDKLLADPEGADAVRAFRMNNPLTLDDVFQLTSGSRFSDTVSDKIKVQIKTVQNENPPILACRLVDTGSEAQTIESGKPNVWIYDRPKPNVEYIQVIDGVGIGKEQGGEKGISKVASVIVKMFDTVNPFSPVCIYYEKPDVVPDCYPNLISQAKFYNKHGLLKGITWEHVQGMTDHFAFEIKKQNMTRFIINRRDTSGKGNVDENKYGQTISNEARKFQYRSAGEFLKDHIQHIKMIMLLEQMLLPIEENADILEAWLLLFSALPANFWNTPPKVRPALPKRLIRRLVTDENGRTVLKWMEA